TLERVMVDGLVDNSYYGLLDIRLDGNPETPVYIDTRPSDALALAVRTGADILVSPEVMQEARGDDFENFEQEQVVTALGITVGVVTDEVREIMELPDEHGLLVLGVIGEAQEKGLGAGALILEVNGEAPTDPLEFLEKMQQTEVGEQATIRYWYNDDITEVQISTTTPDPGTPEPSGPELSELEPRA
ncbi:MAG: bifunctional nuclease domain-containing protein, partial [Natronospirillum sp.]